ncbi:phosphatase PAP2 family protein [Planosporangium sp. 12N6]|uniref:phosphatase PAP2 family protein n=1 Tax=Planosporangium spinosum TaxID=3402278 RepID=UPI003CE7AE37
MRRWPIGLAVWLLVLAGAEVAAVVAVCHFFVQSRHGQLLDALALNGNRIGQSQVEGPVDTILNTMSVLSLAVATAVVGFIALIRRRIAVAVGAILLIVGANVMTQVLKQIIYRPELGVDLERAAAGNSLPSGHTTIAASIAVAFMLVLPPRLRGVGAVLGALFAAAAGVATLSAGWHRPSDAIAALLIVGAWACAIGLFIVIAQHPHGGVDYGPSNRLAVRLLAVTGLVLLAGAGLALVLTEQVLSTPPDELSGYRLLTAYAGGAMGIAGTAGVVLATVLATVHRVVPRVVPSAVEATREPVVLAS